MQIIVQFNLPFCHIFMNIERNDNFFQLYFFTTKINFFAASLNRALLRSIDLNVNSFCISLLFVCIIHTLSMSKWK